MLIKHDPDEYEVKRDKNSYVLKLVEFHGCTKCGSKNCHGDLCQEVVYDCIQNRTSKWGWSVV